MRPSEFPADPALLFPNAAEKALFLNKFPKFIPSELPKFPNALNRGFTPFMAPKIFNISAMPLPEEPEPEKVFCNNNKGSREEISITYFFNSRINSRMRSDCSGDSIGDTVA